MGDIECLILLFEVPAMLQLKPWSASGASHHPLIWATVIHTFFSLIHPVDEFCFKEMSTIRVSPRFHLAVFVFGVNQKIGRQGEYKIPIISGRKLLRRFSSSYRKLLDRAAFRILSNVNDGAPLRKYVERLEMIWLMMVILMVFYIYGELVHRGVGPILGNGQKQPPEVFYKKGVLRNFA